MISAPNIKVECVIHLKRAAVLGWSEINCSMHNKITKRTPIKRIK